MTTPLTADEFASLIASGEDSFVEFKDPRTSNADVVKEMCAFANASGGRVLIGVDDDGAILDAVDWDEERVMNLARTSIDPPIVPTYQRLPWDPERLIAIVGVDGGTEKPYAVRSGEGRRYYVRVGSTSREASREELMRMTQASGAVAGDLRPVLGATLDDLDITLLTRQFAGRRTLDFESLDEQGRRQVLEAADIVEPKSAAPTVAGLLCFGHRPQDHLPHAVLECVSYAGREPARESVDRATAAGRVEEQIELATVFAERNLARPSTIEGLRRQESARPSRESLREVLANAVAHRHYGITGPSHVRVFEDRLEVVSPGEPPNGVSPAAMRVGVSVRRNQMIVQRLVELGLVDAVGRGIVLLVEEAARLGLPEPAIDVPPGFTRVALHLAPEL